MAGSPQDSQGIPLGAPNRRGAQWRDPVTLGCLIAGVLGAAGLVATVALGPHGLVRRIALLGFFCLELAILQIIPLRFTRDEEGEDLALDEAFFVPMALLLTPFETALALGIAMAAGQVYKRSPGLKALFNIGQTLASAAVGLAVFEALRGGAGSAAPAPSPRRPAAASPTPGRPPWRSRLSSPPRSGSPFATLSSRAPHCGPRPGADRSPSACWSSSPRGTTSGQSS